MRFGEKNIPIDGEKRSVTKFAWWPTRVDLTPKELLDKPTAVVWLEKYIQKEKYFNSVYDGGHWSVTGRYAIESDK